MFFRIRVFGLKTISLGMSAVLLAMFLVSSVFANTVAEYYYDAVGNIISIQRTGTALSISSFSPMSGPVGAEVAIYGSGFSSTPSGNTVFFNGVQTDVFYASSALLVVHVPEGATTGTIRVDVGTNTAMSSDVFTVTDQYASPEIESFFPFCGTSGAVVTVTGNNFDPTPGATQAGIGEFLTNANVINSQGLIFTLPNKTVTGYIRVATPSGMADSKRLFFVPPSGSSITCANIGSGLTPIAIEQSKVVKIASGDRAILAFDAQTDDLLSFYFSNIVKNPSNAAISYSLYDPKGTLWKSGSITGQAATFSPPPIPFSGAYILALSVNSNGSADLSIRLARDPIIEVDADPLQLQTEEPGQTARFGIVAEPGQSLGIGLAQLTYNASSTSGTSARLLDPDGNAYTSNSYTGAGTTCAAAQKQCDLNLPIVKQEGVYSVVLTPPAGVTATATATLSSNVQAELLPDVPYTLSLGRIGQDGWLSFEGKKGQNLGIGISNYVASPSTATSMLYIFNPDGSLLKYVTTNGSAAYMEMSPLLATGTYTVWVNPSYGAQVTMTLLLDTGTILQSDGDSKTTQAAGLGGTLRFVFDAEIGQSLGIGISGLTYSPASASGSSVQFLGPDGKVYTSNSNTGAGTTCLAAQKQCDLNLPIVKQSGRHTVLLTPPSGVTATAIFTLSSNVQAELQPNVPYALSLERIGQDGWLTFNGTVGESRSLVFSAPTIQPPGTTLTAYVFKPDGANLKTLSLTASGGRLDLGALPSSGVYWLWVNPNYGATATTTITLQ
ncbi:MAG: IPT/TIG domain-containing protein [Betaproteobacteria bacterium]|nr:IPT/TIG domain-containing protein [Betaproteobacteria bacterium]